MFFLSDYIHFTPLIRYTDEILASDIVSQISNNRPIYLFRRRLHEEWRHAGGYVD